MINKPITAVWEITMGCNMRCKHCGSRCHEPIPGELSTDEALRLCDDISELGLQWITLSGGEPTTRKDWFLIAQRLSQNGVVPHLITNGWLFDQEVLDKAVEAGIATIAFSIDGLQKTHDFMRREGSYQKIMEAVELCRDRDITVTPITTINKLNLGELNSLKQELVKRGVESWQVQMGFPMGNLADHHDLVIDPADIDHVIDFAYQCMMESSIEVMLGDCIGYYNLKEMELFRQRSGGSYSREGCTAGKYTFGILHNGDILGCTSIRDPEFVEGNIREIPLRDIWENPHNFSWNRKMTKEKLDGFCSKCRFADRCLGGCANTKLTTGGSIYAENKYCSYRNSVQERIKLFESMTTEKLISMGRSYAEKGYYQLAESALHVVLQREAYQDVDLLNLYGYAAFRLGDYRTSLDTNEQVLQKDPDAVYALKGKGLCLTRLGEPDEGIDLLKKAVSLTDENFMDPYYDLAAVLSEMGRTGEALSVLKEGRAKSEMFIVQSQALYERLND